MNTTASKPRRFAFLSTLSLNARICASATALGILSLVLTSSFIAVKNSASAERTAMELARTSAREAAGACCRRASAPTSPRSIRSRASSAQPTAPVTRWRASRSAK
ncbi:hypothetical protein G4G31_14475 [Massilia sp. Se16.2.3]|nr:hypothetical protein G4G31_14475 [Massilia sp. Se16.2.3]